MPGAGLSKTLFEIGRRGFLPKRLPIIQIASLSCTGCLLPLCVQIPFLPPLLLRGGDGLVGAAEELVDYFLRLLCCICFRVGEVAVAEAGRFTSNADLWDAVSPPPLVRIAKGVGAATVLLLVEALGRSHLVFAQGHCIGLPVGLPVLDRAAITRSCSDPRRVYLLSILPTAGGIRGRNHREAILRRIEGSSLHTHVEAHGATAPPLRVPFHSNRPGKPGLAVVVHVHEGDP
mmetsp:Transcript_54433/g.117818  ORF Transcript_54433/g.117818 Transcript_54433/m.117818 type:complete len:232 (-) Transcript_54433:396-1091(-)